MRCARPASLAPLLLGLLLSSGCYGPSQQSPYGPWGPYGSPYGGYPGVGGPPIQTLQPGGTYVPGTAPQGTFSPTPADQTSTDGAFYEPNGGGESYDGGDLVPTYNDASDTLQFHEQQHGSPGSTADQTLDAFGSIEGISATVTGAARVDLETAQFVAPVPTSADVSPSTDAMTIPQAPYAYDAEYHWLRGILRFDQESGTWNMTYSSNPAKDDPHAGQILVADSERLAPLKPQAIVLLRGEIDSALSETAGRAIYRADAVETVELALP